jgi:hypothetical protein
MKHLIAIAVVASAVGVGAQKQALTDHDKADAVRIGTKAEGTLTGLVLVKGGMRFEEGTTLDDATIAGGFGVRVYTPQTWVEQFAANAAKNRRRFTIRQITAAMLEPVLRVVVYPDKPTPPGGAGPRGSAIEQIVLQDEAKAFVVQPLTKEPFTDKASPPMRDMAYEGMTATFQLDAVRVLRGPKGDQEFLIVVVGTGSKEKAIRVKQKDFALLP